MMNKEELKSGILNALHGIDPKTATPQQLHQALGETIMEAIAPDWNTRAQPPCLLLLHGVPGGSCRLQQPAGAGCDERG